MNTTLQHEIDQFRAWAVDHKDTYGEWECEYTDWPSLWATAKDAINQSLIHPLDDIDLLNLLYALGRDNEIEHLRRHLIHFPDLLRQLALRAAGLPDYAACWQIAVSVSEARLPDAASLLTPYLTDSNEYVRRRALIALASVDPIRAEEIAIDNLADDFEYMRIAALSVLAEVGSIRVHAEASRMLNDPNEYARAHAAMILKSSG